MAGRRGRGEGNVEQLPSGSWRAALPGRKKAGRSATFPTAGEARRWLREHADKPAPPVGTLSAWLDRWLDLHRGRVAEHSYQSDRSIVKKHIRPALGDVRLRDLDALRIETYLASLKGQPGITPDLRHKIAKTLRNALNAAVKTGKLLPSSPMNDVKMPPAPKPQTRSLTPDELAAVLAAAVALGFGLMFRLWLELGLRPGELIGLQWGDLRDGRVSVVRTIDRATNEEKTPKTPREAPIPITADLAAALEAIRNPDPSAPMFPSPRTGGYWWKTNFLRSVWWKVMRRAKVKAGPQGRYVIRHSTASLLLSAGASIVSVSKRLGHSSPALTLAKYAHTMPTDQQKATDLIGDYLDRLSPRNSPRDEKADNA